MLEPSFCRPVSARFLNRGLVHQLLCLNNDNRLVWGSIKCLIAISLLGSLSGTRRSKTPLENADFNPNSVKVVLSFLGNVPEPLKLTLLVLKLHLDRLRTF